jgi:hypothetical protein
VKLVIFGLLSLLFTVIDVGIGVNVSKVIYGYQVYSLLLSFPFNAIYFLIIYLTEFLVLYFGVSKLLYKIFRRLSSKFVKKH